MTLALANATTTEEVVDAVSRVAVPACAAALAIFYRVSDDGTELACAYDSGRAEARRQNRYRLDSPVPISAVARSREPAWFESRAELLARFPEVRPYVVESDAVAIVPLVVRARVVGVFVLGYHGPERFDPERRAFLSTVASLCAQALERACLFDEKRRARASAEAALCALQALVRSAPLALALLDAGGDVRLWNPAAERMTGYQHGEVLGRGLPGVTAERREELARWLREGAELAGDEAVHARRTGEPHDVALWTAPVYAPNGERLSLLMMADVTERKRAAAIRDDFVALASHELKTPLTSLSLQVQALAQALRRTWPDPPLLGRITPIERQITRLDRIVDTLLDSSHLSSDRLELEPRPTDLAAIVRDVAERAADELALAGSTLTVLADAPVVGVWDRPRLEQVVTNLLSNAMKYGAGRPIELTVLADAERARLTVGDHGIGIAAADQARIFDRFERAVSRQHYGGFGLGLWAASRIVAASGGTISVESAPGEGATFTVELPR